MDLDHVGDHFSACQAEVDAVRSLALSVADIGAEIPGSVAACLLNSFSHLFHQNVQVSASRMAVPECALNHNLRLA